MVKRIVAVATMVVLIALGLAVSASADPPGAGDKQCVPGQNNVGGGPGSSGPGDQQGAPLKAPPSCPGS